MKLLLTAIFVFLSIVTSFGQNTEQFAQKIAAKMCDCIGPIKEYNDLKSSLDQCYDKAINEATIEATTEEIKIIGNIDEYNKVKQMLEGLIKTNCETVKSLVESEVQSASSAQNPCPTNFVTNDLKKVKKNLDKWNGQIVAFNAMVEEVQKGYQDKPYYSVKLEGGGQIWIASLVTSGYETKGSILKILGYVGKTGNDELAVKYNKSGFHVLALSVIDMTTKQLSMVPGSELQVKDWMNGQIPKGE
ncbi:MAG: hypothetical protein OCD76_22985 [Reichenbachiella sp.]